MRRCPVISLVVAIVFTVMGCEPVTVNPVGEGTGDGTDIPVVVVPDGPEPLFPDGKARITLIDDDFILPYTDNLKKICDEIGIKCDFALMPKAHEGHVFFDEAQTEAIAQYKADGYEFMLHPIHTYWAADAYMGPQACVESVLDCIGAFKEIGLDDACRYLVYPNGGSQPGLREACSEYVSYGVTVEGKYNVDVDSPYDLERLLISFSSRGSKSQIKEMIRLGVQKKAWVILGTHIWQFEDENTVDEKTYSLANLREVLEYAKSKAEFITFDEAVRILENKDLQ